MATLKPLEFEFEIEFDTHTQLFRYLLSCRPVREKQKKRNKRERERERERETSFRALQRNFASFLLRNDNKITQNVLTFSANDEHTEHSTSHHSTALCTQEFNALEKDKRGHKS